jgi:hypothetical protein
VISTGRCNIYTLAFERETLKIEVVEVTRCSDTGLPPSEVDRKKAKNIRKR